MEHGNFRDPESRDRYFVESGKQGKNLVGWRVQARARCTRYCVLLSGVCPFTEYCLKNSTAAARQKKKGASEDGGPAL